MTTHRPGSLTAFAALPPADYPGGMADLPLCNTARPVHRKFPALHALGKRFRSGAARLALLCGASAVALSVLYWFPPATSWFYPPCIIRAVTGLHCPGCGVTRALHALLHGDLRAAVHHNLLLVALLPALITFIGVQAFSLAQRGHWKQVLLPRAIPLGLLVLMLAFAIIRNLPYAWASWLAP